MNSKSIVLSFKIITSLLFFLYSCDSFLSKKNFPPQADSIRCFKVTQNFPNTNIKGKLISIDTMVAWVYYYRDQILFYSAYYYNPDALLFRLLNPEVDTNRSPPGSFFLFDTTAIPEVRYRYFIYTKGHSYGSVFDKYKAEYNKRILIDSVLESEWTVQSVADPFIHNTLRLISNHRIRNKGILIEKYSFRGRKDTGVNGTVELSFSHKLKAGGYSLSKNLDSIKNMKLYRVFMITNSRYIKNYRISLDRVEQFSELEEIPVKNREEILKYFELDRDANLKN